MSKYDPLTRWLNGQPPTSVLATFTQIEHLLGFPLPASARKYQAWWANEKNPGTRHIHALSWLNAGRKASPDLKRKILIFS
jgi:hypothetical protein